MQCDQSGAGQQQQQQGSGCSPAADLTSVRVQSGSQSHQREGRHEREESEGDCEVRDPRQGGGERGGLALDALWQDLGHVHRLREHSKKKEKRKKKRKHEDTVAGSRTRTPAT